MFSEKELEYIKEETNKLKSIYSVFFQEDTIKPVNSWIEEAIVNGKKKTLIKFKDYIEKRKQ